MARIYCVSTIFSNPLKESSTGCILGYFVTKQDAVKFAHKKQIFNKDPKYYVIEEIVLERELPMIRPYWIFDPMDGKWKDNDEHEMP